MPTTQSKDTKAAAGQPKQPVIPDGKSELPTDLPGFPVSGGSDPVPSGDPK